MFALLFSKNNNSMFSYLYFFGKIKIGDNMRKKILYMFFILQLLIIITNYRGIENMIFGISLLDMLKTIVTIFSSIYIFFIAKNSINKKIVYASVIFFLYVAFLYSNNSISTLLTNYYYISSFTFILLYFINNKIDKFKASGIAYCLLLVFDFILLIYHQNEFTLQVLLLMMLGIIYTFYNNKKRLIIPIYLLTLLIAIINNMNFLLYSYLIISLLVLFSIRNKKDFYYGISLVAISIITLLLKDLFTLDVFYNTFDKFKLEVNVTSFIIVIPLIIVICYLITRYILQREKSLELKIYIFISSIIVTLMLMSLENIYNEFVLIIFSLLMVLFIDRISNSKKKLKNEITFFVLHLGYGGIESSTINTSNELSEYYKVKIVSFYNLKRNIEDTINERVKVKHLYNGEPNKEELIKALKNKEISNIFKEGFKAAYILLLKEYYVIKEMYNCDSLFTISTRNEFSILLSEYGNSKAVKIAQEHMHHRDNKKYIDNIKYEFNNINYMFALTNSLKKDYEEFLKDNKKTQVIIVPNIIYLPKKKSKLNSKNLITISRLNSIKKIEDMIKIFSNIKSKKSKLYIVGDGEELEKLKKLTSNLDLDKRVIFTGYKTKEEMEEYILDSSIFLLTSWSEGLPMVLLESMSYGVPCIAFKTKSGVSDIIDNNVNGFIIEGRNKEKYVEKIDELIDNKELLNEFSKKSIEKSKQFTSKVIIKKWQEVLEYEKGKQK